MQDKKKKEKIKWEMDNVNIQIIWWKTFHWEYFICESWHFRLVERKTKRIVNKNLAHRIVAARKRLNLNRSALDSTYIKSKRLFFCCCWKTCSYSQMEICSYTQIFFSFENKISNCRFFLWIWWKSISINILLLWL